MSKAARLLFVVTLVVNCVLWSQSRYAQVAQPRVTLPGLLSKRAVNTSLSSFESDECAPRTVPSTEQCTHVSDHCAIPNTALSIPYTHAYFCTSSALRPLAFAGLVLWLIFLFSTLGISASDFFCPNLATLAGALGLDDNVAGVTFLAFGNGSPDMFSTFSAMRANSASLALGELLGAASFIASVVVGAICLVRPFRAHPRIFLRDVGFFIASVGLLQATLWDGKLYLFETLMLVALYVLYVVVVILTTWWARRQARKRHEHHQAALEREEQPETPYRDEPEPASSNNLLAPPAPSGYRPRAISAPGAAPSTLQPLSLHLPSPRPASLLASRASSIGPSSQESSPTSTAMMASFSLVGALEFREFVHSLTPHTSAAALASFDPAALTPRPPFAGGHYSARSFSRTPRSRVNSGHSQGGLHASEQDPWDTALGGSLQLEARAHSPVQDRLSRSLVVEGSPRIGHRALSPQQANTDVSDPDDTLLGSDSNAEISLPHHRTGKEKVMHALERTWDILFPTLHHFGTKSFATKLASVFAAPAVLALTLTLPVVVTPYATGGSPVDAGAGKTPVAVLVDVEGDGGGEGRSVGEEADDMETVERLEEEIAEEMHDGLRFDKWLMAVQCVCGPLFCAKVLFDGTRREGMIELAVGVVGACLAVLVLVFGDRGNNPSARFARCIMGFLVAVVWIMAIADEVVNVLQTFGYIFGLSHAIIGLTIFAMGNSLADLVANISVAAFAPVMGFSACFGGPMLNMLLGVGLSGTYIVSQNGGQPYELEFSHTLLVSSVGLLAILFVSAIMVPLNDFHLTRRWGACLIGFYAVILVVNVLVEIMG